MQPKMMDQTTAVIGADASDNMSIEERFALLTDEEKKTYRCKYCEEKYINPARRKAK